MGSFWQKHKARQARFGSEFGTVAGHQSLAEVDDLCHLYDFRMSALKSSYDASAGKVMAVDPDWIIDYVNLGKRYDAAKGSIPPGPPVGRQLYPAQDAYDGILKALKQVDGIVSKGDFQNLFSRLDTSAVKVDLSNEPKPTAPDADIETFKSADKVTKVIDDAVQKAKEASEKEAKMLKNVAIAGGTALALVAIIAIRK